MQQFYWQPWSAVVWGVLIIGVLAGRYVYSRHSASVRNREAGGLGTAIILIGLLATVFAAGTIFAFKSHRPKLAISDAALMCPQQGWGPVPWQWIGSVRMERWWFILETWAVFQLDAQHVRDFPKQYLINSRNEIRCRISDLDQSPADVVRAIEQRWRAATHPAAAVVP